MDELDRMMVGYRHVQLMIVHKQFRDAYDSLYEDLARIRDHGIFLQARMAVGGALRKHDAQWRRILEGEEG